jgi:DNA-binding NtrC family response regulator
MSELDRVVERLLEGGMCLEEATELLERGMIAGALERAKGNQSGAAKALKIHRNTLQRKLSDYGLSNGRTRARRKPATRAGRLSKPKRGAA